MPRWPGHANTRYTHTRAEVLGLLYRHKPCYLGPPGRRCAAKVLAQLPSKDFWIGPTGEDGMFYAAETGSVREVGVYQGELFDVTDTAFHEREHFLDFWCPVCGDFQPRHATCDGTVTKRGPRSMPRAGIPVRRARWGRVTKRPDPYGPRVIHSWHIPGDGVCPRCAKRFAQWCLRRPELASSRISTWSDIAFMMWLPAETIRQVNKAAKRQPAGRLP